MSLIYSSTPENIPLEANTPIFRDWRPQNTETNYYWSNVVPGTIVYLPITFGIKEVVNNPDFAQYVSFSLQVSSGYKPGTTSFWMDAAVPPLSITPVFLPFYMPNMTTDLEYVFTPLFKNLALQTPGVKTFFVKYRIVGKTASGATVLVSEYEHLINLNVSNSLAVYSPSALNFQHTKNTTLPSRNVSVSGANWKIQAPTTLALSSVSPGVTIGTETDEDDILRNYASGSGEAVITTTLTAFYDAPTLNAGTYSATMRVLSGSTIVGNIPVTIVVAALASFYATPTSLTFSAVKGVSEASSKLLYVFCSSSPYIVEKSPWLTMEIIGVGSGGNATDFRVKPISTSNMEPGQYTGFIKLKDNVSGVDIEVNVPVKYFIDGFINNPYATDKPAFTLDSKFFEFSSTNQNSYIQLSSIIKTFDFFTDVENTFTINEKLPLFQGKAKLNFGQTIHKLMDKFNETNENLLQYKPAKFSVLVEEIDIETGEKLKEASIDNINFIAGLSENIELGIGFLHFNEKPIRVTKNGNYIFNVYVPDSNEYEIRLYKNEVLHQTIYLGFAFGHILSKKITFDTFSQGDKVKASLNKVGQPTSKSIILPPKIFYVFPNQKYSWNIIWENEFLLQSVLECTGGLNAKSDFEYKSNNLFQNLVEVLEHIETTKVSKITVNTGWILATQIDDIESLMRSKRVWIDLSSKRIALRPISKTKIDIDTDRDLIDYSIEFQINRKYDQETYSF